MPVEVEVTPGLRGELKGNECVFVVEVTPSLWGELKVSPISVAVEVTPGLWGELKDDRQRRRCDGEPRSVWKTQGKIRKGAGNGCI